MPAFAYQAVDYSGKRIRGEQEAPSPEAVTRALETRGLVVVQVAPCDTGPARGRGVHFGRSQAVLELTRALAALLQAGLPLARAGDLRGERGVLR